MYTVKNISGVKARTPYADFEIGEEKQFQQILKGDKDTIALKFFKESPQFVVTGGVDENQGVKGDKGDTGTAGADGADGASIAVIVSGLVAAVQNAARYAVGAQGGVGQATLANGEIMIPVDGSLSDFITAPNAAVTGLASVDVTVFVNGVATALTANFLNADGTTAKTAAGPVAVVAGDLVAFEVKETADVAPVANFHASVKFTAT